jgi:O-acetyl-ADP-ribose deacetylase (regulator of RNase III)
MNHYTNTENPVDFPKPALKHAKGNLLDLAEAGEFDVIFHGANCFNTMGGGIAREIRERYPEVAIVDSKTVSGDYNKLGNWTNETVIRKNGSVEFIVLNCYTQYNMSRGHDVFEYAAFQLILQKIEKQYGDQRLGLPYIGTGLAGGNKERIMAMIEDFANKVSAKGGNVTLVEYSLT